jgi:hypothetical protein
MQEDFCTMFPEGIKVIGLSWQHCCVAHDNAYTYGTTVDRKDADAQLLSCVNSSGDALLAVPALFIGFLMFAGVRVFGKRYYNKPPSSSNPTL